MGTPTRDPLSGNKLQNLCMCHMRVRVRDRSRVSRPQHQPSVHASTSKNAMQKKNAPR